MSALLSIRSLHAAYGNIEALKGVDLDVSPGEIVALIGANGAGKSTLMMTIFGRPRAHEGEIIFDGDDITHVPSHQIAQLRHQFLLIGNGQYVRQSADRVAPKSAFS